MTPSSPAPSACRGADPAAEVYAAEARSLERLGELRRFGRFSDLVTHVQRLTASDWWDDTFPGAPGLVELHRRSHRATASFATTDAGVGVIVLVDGHGWSLDTVLHELAHIAAGPAHGHTERFRVALVELWRHEAGIEAATVLASELRV
jgi:putative metallohydrolase (TIGR04338 family)